MRKLIACCVLAVALAFALPLLFVRSGQSPVQSSRTSPSPDMAGSLGESCAPAEDTVTDGEMELRVLTTEGVETMSMADYLPMALAGEMPASFKSEALKAQAVALRSYALYLRQSPKAAHPEADICTSSSCCAAAFDEQAMRSSWGDSFDAYYAAVTAAVKATDGQYLCWEDQPILAVFHSCSEGFTEAGENVWSALPYLQSVSSPETDSDVRSFVTTVEVSPEDFRASILRTFPGLSFPDDPAAWLGEVKPNSAGRVGSLTVAGQEISGLAMRQLFSLRSTDFSVVWNGAAFVFTVSGYGHGVGMSQYGANVMAAEGADYAEILAHYYPGTQLVVAVLG